MYLRNSVAAGAAGPPARKGDTMGAQENVALARQVYEAFNRGDLEGAAALATDDIEVDLVAFGMVTRGRAAFRDQFMGGFKRAFPDLVVTVVNQVATEDQVVDECTWRGTHTGPLMSPGGDIPPTGKAVEGGRFCEVWRIRDGKVAKLVNYQDATTWMRQLGLVS
jgi:steroid delta-isomerase-like uncharacterized protein